MSSVAAIADYIIDLLEADLSLGLHDVFYGDMTGIPNVPAVSVIPGPSNRTYTQTGLQTTRSVRIELILYHSRVADKQDTLREGDQRADDIEDALHADSDMGGLVINGLVTEREPGYVSRGKVLFTAHRLAWEGLIKERIGV